MAAFLITGNPGSGKTTLAEELSRRGLIAIDPDYVPRLCYYEDDAGNTLSRAEGPLMPDEHWLRTHHWVWSRARLEEIVCQHPGPIFICGIARNIAEVLDVFERVFLLRISADTQEERLIAYDRSNATGRNDAGRQQIRAGRPIFEAEMLALGAIPVDGNASTEAVADEILRLVTPYALKHDDAVGL